VVQGSGIDSDLNAFGRRQAELFFEAYNTVPFDRIYTSALKRTRQSVEKFVELGLPVAHLRGLNEISWGTKEGYPITPEEDEYYHFMLSEWQKGRTGMRIEGGESPEDVVARMKPAFEEIMSHENERTILICMHGRAIRILLCHLLNYPLRSMDMFDHSNLCLYLLNFSGTMFNVERYNDLAHLRSLRLETDLH
jgi:broad specificity phosphatase PhoE